MSLSLPNVIAFYCTRYVHAGATAAVPPPFRHGKTALCGSHPLVTPYYCRLGDLLCFVFICLIIVFLCYLCTIPLVLWYCWLALLTCKNRLPYNLYGVGGNVKHCSNQYRTRAVIGYEYVIFPITYVKYSYVIPERNARSYRVWCNRDCKEAIRHRRKAQKRTAVTPTTENTEHFRVQRAKCRKTLSTSCRQSWQTFVSKINSRTSLRKVWNVTGK